MLITCSSCNSKYLVNSADLKPNGRIVRCAKCGFDWLQSSDFLEENKEPFNSSAPLESNKYTDKKIDSNTESGISNLPSTYVMDQKPSVVNTLLLLIIFGAIIFIFWIMKNESDNVIVLTNYYVHEFYFNLKLIIRDFTKIIHQILD